MLHRIALLAIAAARRILVAAALIMIAAAVFGIPVAKSLSAGGFQDPNAESSQASRLLTSDFHQGDMQMLVSVTSPDGATSPRATAVAMNVVDQLRQSPHVAGVTSAWTVPPSAARALISEDGRSGLVVAGITGGENDAQKYARALSADIAGDRDGVTVRAGGTAMVYVQVNEQTQRDLLVMESIAIPLSFLVLVWGFGGLVAAAVPMLVGGLAIVESMAVLRLITYGTDVSTRRTRRSPGDSPAGPSTRADAQARGEGVLVPLHQGRHAARDSRGAGRRRPPAGPGRPVPQRQVGFPR